MLEGFIFELKGKYFFIRSTRKNRNKADASIILNYFTSRLANEGKTFTIEQLTNTHEFIKKNMYKAEIRQSDDFQKWYIQAKDLGACIGFDDLIAITE